MIYYYGNELSPNQIETVEGFLVCRNVPIARTGTMEYKASDLQLEGDPDRVIVVDRREEDVFESAAVASFEGKPVTDGHPPEEVNPTNFAAYSKGHAENVRRDGDFVVADLYINDPVLISEVRNGVKREVSCGYMCTYVNDSGTYKQTKIRGNHVAVVPRGRAGHEVSIKDSIEEGGKNKMGKLTKELLKVFGTATKDAKAEEIDEMTTTVAAVLDAVPTEKVPEAEPTTTDDETIEKAPKGDDLGTKLDRVIEMLGTLMKNSNTADETNEQQLSDESDIDKEIDKLSSEASGTVPADGENVNTDPAKDMAALEILKKVRPVIAAIEDRSERAKVTDALLSAVKGEDKVSDILTATRDSAGKGIKKSYEEICRAQKEAYDALNPHKNKEGK